MRYEQVEDVCQTVIEPTLDMWMREKRQHNIVVNDPKGELLVKNYVRATVRGYQAVQFNLINPQRFLGNLVRTLLLKGVREYHGLTVSAE